MRLAPFLLALAPAFASAAPATEPSTPLKPFAFLAGHCWKGTFPGTLRTDEHCFAWMLDGQGLRDTHVVRAPGQADAHGETIYYFDSTAGHVAYLYLEDGGGFMRGTVEPAADGLVFPETDYVEAGETTPLRVRWTRQGDDAYESLSEMRTPRGWSTMFKIVFQRES